MSGRPPDRIDWSITTWEGSRREQMRRWAQASLEEIICTLEKMEEASRALAPPAGTRPLMDSEPSPPKD